MLEERKRKSAKYDSEKVLPEAEKNYARNVERADPPEKLKAKFERAAKEEQIHDLEYLWYSVGDDRSRFARQLVQVVQRLGEKYQVEELLAKYKFTGRTLMDVAKALEVKEELEKIDKLLEQLEEAAKNAQIGIIDLDLLEQFTEPGDRERLEQIQKAVEDLVRQMAEQQGLERDGNSFRLTPQAMRLFQGKLLSRIFSELTASKTGRHNVPVQGEGAVELPATKPFEFGDSLTQMDIPQSFVNAMLRQKGELPLRLTTDDIEIHKTRNTPKCATVVIMDMSGSMRHDGQYVNVKRMALAMEGLIRREYPGDYLQFIEMATFPRIVQASEIVELLPKPVTLFDPVVRLKVDMSKEEISEALVPPHFTNIQRALQMARQLLATQDTPNRQIVLITDGLPTAHFSGQHLYLLYPPDALTEQATMREGALCARDHITINMFLIPSWSQSEEDIRFTFRVAESTKGRVFFTAGKDLDRYVVWDYIKRRKEILS
ncbi:MAG: VWA domain-containing protein [Pirellulales bacterium]